MNSPPCQDHEHAGLRKRHNWRRLMLYISFAIIFSGTGLAVFHKPVLRTIARIQNGKPGDQIQGNPAIYFGFGPLSEEWNAPEPWRSRSITGAIDLFVEESIDRDETVLRIKSSQSHYIIWDQTRSFDPAEYPILEWSWMAITLPQNGDVRTHNQFYFSKKNKNDKGLQILVGFENEKVLMYAWDTTAPVGTEVTEKSPVATIATRIIDSGEELLGTWRQHEINIFEDFTRRFGEEPGMVVGISIQTNSNHTSSSSEGLISPIKAKPDKPSG